MTEVTIYSARYGHRWTRPLLEVLSEAAGRPVDLAAERRAIASLLDVH